MVERGRPDRGGEYEWERAKHLLTGMATLLSFCLHVDLVKFLSMGK